MGRKAGTVFQSQEKTVSLSVKIPESLKKRIDELRDRLEQVDPNLSFNTSQICADTLEVAVKSGEAEIAQLSSNRPNGAGAGQTVHS